VQPPPQNAPSCQLSSLTTTTPTNRSSSILGQSALPSEAAEIAAAALAIVKPNYATTVYGTLTPSAREQAITGLQQPENDARSKRSQQGHSRTPTGAEKRRKDLQTRKKIQRQLAKQITRMPSPQPGSGNNDTAAINEDPTNQTEQLQKYPDTENAPKK